MEDPMEEPVPMEESVPMEDTLASFPASSPPESQPAPDTSAAASEPAPENEKLAERIRALTRKLREAVTVANAIHRALECERKEGDEEVRRLQYGLMMERSAHHQLKQNPMGLPRMPTPAEVQARMAAEAAKQAAKQAKEEHRKQAQIESDLRRKLAGKIESDLRLKEARDKKAKNAAWNKAVVKHHQSPAVQSGAMAIALKKGRNLPIFADFSEFHRVGRLLRPDDLRPDDHPRTSPVTSTSLKPCTPSSSGPACP
jgi:hypothetical protein